MAHARDIGLGQFAALLPAAGALHQVVDAGAVSPRRHAEQAQGRQAAGLLGTQAGIQPARRIFHPVRGDPVVRQALQATRGLTVERRQGRGQGRTQRRVVAADAVAGAVQGQQHGALEQRQLVGVQIAEQPGGGEQQVAALFVSRQRPALQALDDAAAVPLRFDAEQFEAEGDHRPLVAHRVRGPEDHRLAAVRGDRPLTRLQRHLAADAPADATGQQAAVEGVEVAPGGQRLRGADRVVALAGGDEAAVQGMQQRVHLGGRRVDQRLAVLRLAGAHGGQQGVHRFRLPGLAEHMQAHGHEAFLDIGQVVADLVHQQVVVDLLEADAAQGQDLGHRLAQLRLQPGAADQALDLGDGRAPRRPFALAGAGLEALDQLAQLEQVVVQRRGHQRRGQVIDHHCQAAALGLDALADPIDDVRVDARQVAEDLRRVVLVAQADPPPRQELVGGMAAQVDQRVGLEVVAQPVIEGQVLVRRREHQVGVQQLLVHFPAARRLRADEHLAELQPRQQQAAVMHHHIAGALAPAAQAFDAGGRQGLDQRLRLRPVGLCRLRQRCPVEALQLRQQVQGACPRRVLDAVQHVVQLAGAVAQDVRRDVQLRGLQGPAQLGVPVAQRALAHLRLQGRRQGGEPVAIVLAAQALYLAGHLGQGIALFRQVDPALLQQVEQCRRTVRQRAGVVALGLQAAEDLQQRLRHVEVVRADVVTARRVVVVNDCQALVGIGRALQVPPALDARAERGDLLRQRFADAETDARQRVELLLAPGGQDHGLAGALQFRHGDLVVQLVARQAVAGQLPGRFVAPFQAQALEYRHVQPGEQLADLFTVLAAADDEILQGDNRRQRRVLGLLQPAHRLQGTWPPVGEQADAGQSGLVQRLAQGVVERPVAGAVGAAVVDDGHQCPALPVQLFGRADLPVLVEA